MKRVKTDYARRLLAASRGYDRGAATSSSK